MDYSKILEEIFDNGFATHTVSLIPDKLDATIKNLSGEDYLDIDDKMMDEKGSKLKVYQLYGLQKLAHALVKYKNITFNNSDEAFEYISKLAVPVVDRLLKEQDTFEKQVREALKAEEIEENFFEKADSQVKQEQSPKE
jgi:hypothetical protein